MSSTHQANENKANDNASQGGAPSDILTSNPEKSNDIQSQAGAKGIL